jgi:ABC-type enterochelin transport system ATPase subunit
MYFRRSFFLLKRRTIRYAGTADSIDTAVIKDIFDIDMQIIEIGNKRIILGGKDYENY